MKKFAVFAVAAASMMLSLAAPVAAALGPPGPDVAIEATTAAHDDTIIATNAAMPADFVLVSPVGRAGVSAPTSTLDSALHTSGLTASSTASTNASGGTLPFVDPG